MNVISVYMCMLSTELSESVRMLNVNTDVTWTILPMSLLLDLGTMQLQCCLQRVRALRFYQKYLNVFSEDERISYRFGTTRG